MCKVLVDPSPLPTMGLSLETILLNINPGQILHLTSGMKNSWMRWDCKVICRYDDDIVIIRLAFNICSIFKAYKTHNFSITCDKKKSISADYSVIVANL